MSTEKVTKKKHLSDLHFEHTLWAMEVEFYKGELQTYQKWLAEIAAKNTGQEVLKQVEHFQNQFMIQGNQLALLHHQIKAHEQELANYAESHPIDIEHQSFVDHATIRQSMETFKTMYTDLKTAFKHFVEEWM